MRADRRQRVDLRPGREDDEERHQKADDCRNEERRPEGEEQRPQPRDDREDRDHGRRLIDADGAEEERRGERDRSDEHGGTARQRPAGEDAECRERDEPADEHEGRTRAGVVGACEPHVETGKRCGRVAVGSGANRRRLSGCDRVGSGRDVRERDEPVDPRRTRGEHAAVARPDDRDGIARDVVM